MTEFADMVERQRLLQEVEKWSKSIKHIHYNNGVRETKYNSGEIQFLHKKTGNKTWKRKRSTKRTLIDKFLRRPK